MNPEFQRKPTLCWDCKKATGGCLWSSRLLPVHNWKVERTRNSKGEISCRVLECPEFERDAVYGGQQRWKE